MDSLVNLPRFIYLLVVFLMLSTSNSCNGEDTFSEELFIRNLPNGRTYFHFQFVTTWHVNYEDAFEHYRLFPKSLGDVLSTYSVRELHISMTQGLWRHREWGYPVLDAPPGAELWVWFNEGDKSVDDRWRELTNTLSGLFCASLNFMDQKSSVSPQRSFRPSGLDAGSKPDSAYLRYSALPREIVCTENLTPWKKLLPCDSKAGLAYLFNAIKLYDTDYHSLGVHFRPVCRTTDCTHSSLELSLTLSVVFNPLRNSHTPDWSLKKLFDRSIIGKCPFAATSKAYVEMDAENKVTIHPPPTRLETVTKGGKPCEVAVYDIVHHTDTDQTLNIGVKYLVRGTSPMPRPPLTVHRFVTGHGLQSGGVSCHLHNDLDTPLTVIYMDTIPWFIRVFYHTLVVKGGDGSHIKPASVHYRPGRDRVQPYLLELVITLRPRSLTTISFEFQRAFLKWTEYPPDANHGFYINSAVVSVVLPTATDYRGPLHSTAHLSNMFENSTGPRFLRVHTENLLVSLPTPDFSMPYNVICLACTVVAIAFGSFHNLATREFCSTDPREKTGIVEKAKAFLRRLRGGAKGAVVGKDENKTESKTESNASGGMETDSTNDMSVDS